MKPIELTKNINKIARDRNKLFKSATKTERRILVARDVIERINTGKYTPERGSWATVYEDDDETNPSLQKALIANEVTCQCCALGALMLSNVSYCNNIKTNKASEELSFHRLNPLKKSMYMGNDARYYATSKKIEDKSDFLKLFSKKQLALIEYAFEGGGGMHKDYTMEKMGFDEQTINRAYSFGRIYEDRERVLKIMQNIIDNEGVFIP